MSFQSLVMYRWPVSNPLSVEAEMFHSYVSSCTLSFWSTEFCYSGISPGVLITVQISCQLL